MAKILSKVILMIIVGITAINGSLLIYGLESDNVHDDIGLLSQSEVIYLQNQIEEIQAEYNHDVVIVITSQMNGKSSMVYADDYFDYNGYGLGSDRNGILMLINMHDREVWFSTSGKSIDVFTDSRIDSLVSNAQVLLKNSEYNNTCKSYLADIKFYLEKGVPEGAYRIEDTTYLDRVIRNIGNIFFYVGALVITVLAIIGITLASKGKVTINNRTYEDSNSFKLTNSIDQYLYQRTTRRKIESTSSSGSSTHSSSSGSSHGGGGGSF